MALFKNLFEKLSKTPEETRNEGLRMWAATIPNATEIHKLETRQRACVAGVIQNIRIDPTDASGSIEATIIDGTGEAVVRWLGRRTMSGIRLGMGLVVDGIVGTTSHGEPMILNPEYQLVVGPEHG